MQNPKLKKILGEKFTPDEVKKVIAFIEKEGGFSYSGELALAGIFLCAARVGKTADEVLSGCEKEWNRSWKFQPPYIRGCPQAPQNIGEQNRCSLSNILNGLGISDPCEGGTEIPTKPMVVKTLNSTYRMGETNKEGSRPVTRDKRPLDFKIATVAFLAIGRCMLLVPSDSEANALSTSPVMEIVVG